MKPGTEVSKQDNTPESPPMAQADRNRSFKTRLAALIILLVAAAVLISGIISRTRTRANLRTETAQMAVPTVSVVIPKRAAPSEEIVLPANVQPFITSPIYSRTNGYLKKWYFDIGAHVKKGQLMAVIETPEVDQQLAQSRSNLATAQANLTLAEITAQRYSGLLNSDAVSKQEADNAISTYNANKAIVAADQANVRQLEALQSFEKIYAPFDGIVTARNTDIGDLINSGSTGGPKTDLFHISQSDKLRVYVNVPEEYSATITPGLTADLTLQEFPGRRFQGTLIRTANAINLTTRTLLVEIAVDNPTGTLLSGSYAEVHLKVPEHHLSYIIPVNTLIFRSEGLHVGVVKNGKMVLTAVTAGHDFGSTIEIVAGLNADDQVIVNPPDSIMSGQPVQVNQVRLPGDLK